MGPNRFDPTAPSPYVPQYTYEQAVAQWALGDKRGAETLWEQEFRRREAAMKAGVPGAEFAFFTWKALRCNLCGGGPRRCKSWCGGLDAEFE